MKRKNNIQSWKQTGSLIFGLAMAMLLFFQQPDVNKNLDIDESTEQSDEKQSQSEYRIMAYDVLLPVMQFNLFHSFDLILEIPNAHKEDFTLFESVEKAYHNYFYTLFRLIISPNAP
jgi:DNA integrity scanning protein DisA with diadenylate cyclase activity